MQVLVYPRCINFAFAMKRPVRILSYSGLHKFIETYVDPSMQRIVIILLHKSTCGVVVVPHVPNGVFVPANRDEVPRPQAMSLMTNQRYLPVMSRAHSKMLLTRNVVLQILLACLNIDSLRVSRTEAFELYEQQAWK